MCKLTTGTPSYATCNIISFCNNIIALVSVQCSLKVEFVILSFDLSLSPDLRVRNMLSVKKKPIVTALCLLLIVLPSTKNLFVCVNTRAGVHVDVCAWRGGGGGGRDRRGGRDGRGRVGGGEVDG